MRVKLTAIIVGPHIDPGKVTQSHELHVKRRLYKVDSRHSAVWNNTSIVAQLSAVRNNLLLNVTKLLSRILRRKGAPIIDAVNGNKTRN